MRTRNADSSSKSATPKKTPPARKAATKTAGDSSAAKRTPAVKTRQIKKKDAALASTPTPDSIPEQSPDEPKSCEASTAATNSSKRKTPGRPRKAVATPKLVEQFEAVADETPAVYKSEAVEKLQEPQDVEVVDARSIDGEKAAEQDVGFVGQVEEKEQKPMEVDVPVLEVTASRDASSSFRWPEHTLVDLNISVDDEDAIGSNEGEKGGKELKEQEGEKRDEDVKEWEGEKGEELKEQEGEKREEELKEQEVEKREEELNKQEGAKREEELKEQEGAKREDDVKELEGENKKEELKEQDSSKGGEALSELEGDKRKEEFKQQEGEEAKEESKDETNIIGPKEPSNTESFNAEVTDHLQKDVSPRKDGDGGTKSSEKLEHEEDPEEPPEETGALEEEHMELEAIAKQRKIKKEHEIFVGGLDRDATEEDLRNVFQRIGEVVEVRLHKNSSTNKNKGYAFVKFANKEHAKKALMEMKNPVIRGKRCGTAPSEDNDTLFLGNICNTWTKEAIKLKLKDYGIEEVENVTLVSDVQQEGLSRGFAFLEFSCHADAMAAYKRLQKPDAIFGHPERSAKVAFAEPMREPDPEIMAQVKSVFVNGLPPHWDEDHVRELFQSYGEIVRVVLARNMPTAKRKDYGFVDFSTHEAAVACVEAVNKSDLSDGSSKIKVRARLSNPLPKTQAVKGGMCGGFRIGHTRSGAFARSGRGFGRGRQPFNNWGNNRDRNVYRGGHRPIGRMGFRNDLDFNMYPDFHHRQFGPQGAVRGGHYPSSRGAAFAGPYHDREWYGIPAEGPSEPFPSRRPYSPGGQFTRPFMERHFDDPYFCDDNVHGTKRPFYMTDPEPDYMGPDRLRPRLDYADPSLFHENRYHDSFGAGSRQYPPHDYYGSDPAGGPGGPYSSYCGGGSSHGRGYYY